MSELEQNIPDDFWQKAFEEAAETPPPRVWDAVERRLDEGDGPKILPLWGAGPASSRPFVWGAGMAAAVALLLVGWWALRTNPPGNPVAVAPEQSSSQAERVAATLVPKATDCWPSVRNKTAPGTIALNQQATPIARDRQGPVPAQPANQPPAESLAQTGPDPIAATAEPAGEQRLANAPSIQPVQQAAVPAARTDVSSNDRMAFAGGTVAPATLAKELRAVSAVPALPTAAEQTLFFDPISTSALRLREPGSIQRIVWFRPAEPLTAPTAVQPKRESREVWASVGLMPGAFNPSVAVRPAQTSFTRADALSNTSTSQPSVNSRASFSVAYQAGAGVQLTERWSVESGVGYLAGRSTVYSPVQASVYNLQSTNVNRSGQGGNLYVDALRNSSSSALPTASSSTTSLGFYDAGASTRFTVQNNYNPQTRQSLTNDYQFVQVPVQVGYQLRPRKRLGLALLGGFLSNIFVRNTVSNDLVITAKNGVYRPVSWAATVGARFRYRPSRQWSASLAGVYQPALGPGTRPESIVQTHPTSTGMSFGIDYHF